MMQHCSTVVSSLGPLFVYIYISYYDNSPNECVTLVFEYPNFLDVAERSERLLHQFVGKPTRESATVHGAVGWARLIVHFVERQRFGVG